MRNTSLLLNTDERLFLGGLHRKGGKKLYSFTLCIVWACVIADFMLHWQRNYEAFVTNNSTPLAIFLELNAGTASPFVGIPGTLLVILSDGILASI